MKLYCQSWGRTSRPRVNWRWGGLEQKQAPEVDIFLIRGSQKRYTSPVSAACSFACFLNSPRFFPDADKDNNRSEPQLSQPSSPFSCWDHVDVPPGGVPPPSNSIYNICGATAAGESLTQSGISAWLWFTRWIPFSRYCFLCVSADRRSRVLLGVCVQKVRPRSCTECDVSVECWDDRPQWGFFNG